MERRCKLLILLSLIVIFSTTGIGQVSEISRYALNFGLGTEKVGVPFRKMMAFPTHSSYYFGLERKWDKSGEKNHFQTLDIFSFKNNSAGSGYTVQTAFGAKYGILRGIYFSPSIGGGLVHLFRPKESFSLIDGRYQTDTDSGKIFPDLCLSIKVAYQLNSFGLFGAYHINTLFGYSEDLGILPFTFLTVGARYEI